MVIQSGGIRGVDHGWGCGGVWRVMELRSRMGGFSKEMRQGLVGTEKNIECRAAKRGVLGIVGKCVSKKRCETREQASKEKESKAWG